MASISRIPNGHRTIQFVAADGKRKSIRLGKISQRLAEEIRVKVEQLNAAAIAGYSPDNETVQWLARVGDNLHAKLAVVGLVSHRGRAKLEDFLDNYIAGRTDIKPNTCRNLEAAKARLLEFFGGDRNLRDITAGDADAWIVSLREKYANATAGRTIKRAKQFFRAAVRMEIIGKNPFADAKVPSQVNEARKFFVTLDMAYRVLEACPDAEWRLIFALSRFGGLRCPSEHLAFKWNDVDWERDRFKVTSSKTEHLEGGGVRWVPIFPELRPYLEEAFDLAPEGTVYVIKRYRDGNQNLRTQLNRIIRRAGLEPWPKLFHNLRASRETELAKVYPAHVFCAWIGNTERIAVKHYLQVTENYFEEAAGRAAESGAQNSEKALQSPVQQPAASTRTDLQETKKARKNQAFLHPHASGCGTLPNCGLPPRGTPASQS